MTTLGPLADLWNWLVSLPPDFAFLLFLPFGVALTAVLAELGRWRRREARDRRSQPRTGRRDGAGPVTPSGTHRV